jgi:hypothetical protein
VTKHDLEELARNEWVKILDSIPRLEPNERELAMAMIDDGHGFGVTRDQQSEPQSLNESVLATEGWASHKARVLQGSAFPSTGVESLLFKIAARQFAQQTPNELNIRPDYIRVDEVFPFIV